MEFSARKVGPKAVSYTHLEPELEMQDMYQYILDCDLLIIDDLLTELKNTFVASQLFYCINERLLRKKSTIRCV